MFDEDDIDSIINRCKFSRTQINSFKARDQALKQNINVLQKKLQALKEGVLDDYKVKLNEIENECKDRLSVIHTWYEAKKNEIEMQYQTEYKSAVNEYQEKARELKENLRNEHEEKRKCIEIEKNSLDINMDSTEVKPAVTRKLRRRANETPTSATTTGSLLNTLLIASQTTMTVSSSQCTSTNQTTNYFSSIVHQSAPSYASNERKRRPSPATQLSCTLNDDEINDDLKYLNKNFNMKPQQVLSVLNELSSNDEQSTSSSINKSPIKIP